MRVAIDTPALKRQAALEWARLRDAFHPRRLRQARPPRWEHVPRWMKWTGGTVAVLVAAIALFLAWFDWNMLRGPIARYASERTGRAVRIDGNLRVRLLTWTPTATVEGLKVGNPAWAPRGDMAQIESATASVDLIPLLHGDVQLPLLAVRRPNVALFRDQTGRANWNLDRKSAKPFKLPPIRNFIIEDGKLTALDLKRRLAFAGTVNANERPDAEGDAFRLEGKGELNGKLFVASAKGGPLLNVRHNRPYLFDADVRAGGTHVTAKGAIPKPFDLGILDAAVTVSGDDLNNLYYLTGLTLPNTPAYRVSGWLKRDGLTYHFTNANGRIGGSDVHGQLTVETASGRPFIKGELTSDLLDFKDLGTLFGAPLPSKAASPEQKVAAAKLQATGRLLPDEPLQIERIRAMDADVHYQAKAVKAPGLPLRRVELGVKLDHGVMSLNPIALHFPSGRLSGTARIDASKDTPESDVDMRVVGLRLEEFVKKVGGQEPLSGLLAARAKLHGRGNSVHKTAATANGAMTLVIPRGQVRQLFAELMGIDATKSLFLYLAKDQSPTDIRCAVAEFQVRGGVLYAQRVLLDTGVVVVAGKGSVNLGDETLDLSFKGQPKKFRLIRVAAPITVGGSLRSPKFGVDVGAAATQTGVGIALGVLLTPLAAILPFVDPGLGKDANCAGLIQEAQAGRAPVTGASVKAPAPRG